MKIIVTGATGYVDNAVVQELAGRGHEVAAFARNTDKVFQAQNVAAVSVSVNVTDFADKLTGFNAVVSAFNPGWTNPSIDTDFTRGANGIVEAAKAAQVPYLLIVGGTDNLYTAPDLQAIDTPDFPREVYDGASAAHRLLVKLLSHRGMNWSFVSPPAQLGVDDGFGEDKADRYHLGKGDLLMGGEILVGISVADLAVAIAGGVEDKTHLFERFTVTAV